MLFLFLFFFKRLTHHKNLFIFAELNSTYLLKGLEEVGEVGVGGGGGRNEVSTQYFLNSLSCR